MAVPIAASEGQNIPPLGTAISMLVVILEGIQFLGSDRRLTIYANTVSFRKQKTLM